MNVVITCQNSMPQIRSAVEEPMPFLGDESIESEGLTGLHDGLDTRRTWRTRSRTALVATGLNRHIKKSLAAEFLNL